MFSKTPWICMLALGLLACEGEETNAPTINCGAGTVLGAAGDACEPNLSEGLSVNAAGEIVADTAGADTEAALAAAREEGHAAGVASVDITTDNQAAFDEGSASVTPLNCAEGTAVNEAGDACEPNLSVDVAIDDEDTIVPTDAYAEQVCTDAGGAFDAETGACAPAYDCFRGGYCSEAARRYEFGAQDGNLYDGDTVFGSGCARSRAGEALWAVGTWCLTDTTVDGCRVRMRRTDVCVGN